jgi:hypothetical protein
MLMSRLARFSTITKTALRQVSAFDKPCVYTHLPQSLLHNAHCPSATVFCPHTTAQRKICTGLIVTGVAASRVRAASTSEPQTSIILRQSVWPVIVGVCSHQDDTTASDADMSEVVEQVQSVERLGGFMASEASAGVVGFTFLWVSYIVNIVVTYTVSAEIFRGHPGMKQAYGPDSGARRILTCVYLSIGTLSLVALATPLKAEIAWVLFPMQIFYKLLTLPVVADSKNPVPWFNLGISILHRVTLGLNWDVLRRAMGW